MAKTSWRWWILAALLAGLPASLPAQLMRYDFHRFAEGPLPADWEAGPGWSVVLEPERQINILRFAPDNAVSGNGSLALSPAAPFQDGVIQARLRGSRGFGIAWRVQDPGRFYLLVYDPHQGLLRLEVVENRIHTSLGSATRVRVDGGGVVLKIRQSGARVQAFLDNQLLLDSNDNSIPAAGRVGLWSPPGGGIECEYLTVEPGTVLFP